MPRPPGTCTRPAAKLSSGSRPVTSSPSKKIVPRCIGTSPQMALQQRRLAGAVGAEQGDDLALGQLEVDAEEHLHRPVAHVEVAHDEDR